MRYACLLCPELVELPRVFCDRCARARSPYWFDCGDCGERVAVDEDACCAHCGRDAIARDPDTRITSAAEFALVWTMAALERIANRVAELSVIERDVRERMREARRILGDARALVFDRSG